MKKVINRMCKATSLFAFRLWKEKITNKKFAIIRMNTQHEEDQIKNTTVLL